MSISLKTVKVEFAEKPVGVITFNPRFSWLISSDEKNVKQEAYRIVVKAFIDTPVWDTGWVESDESLNITYKGETLSRDTEYYVELFVRAGGKEISAKTEFRTGLLGYIPPHIGWIRPNCEEKHYKFSPYMRREFSLKSDEIAFATAYVSARGWYDLFFNGESVDPNAVMKHAAYMNYDKTYYTAYDITNMLKTGKNAIGVHMGNGYDENFRPGHSYTGGKRFWAFISIVFTDGSYQHIITDDQWKWSKSPITFDHIYDGEWYDARLEQPGWNKPGFSDGAWEPIAFEVCNETILPLFIPPVRVLGTRPVVDIKKFSDTKSVYDFKFNGSGVVKIKVKGEPGAQVIVHTAENKLPDGNIQVWTNRNAEATLRYTLKGEGEEVYVPTFTYHCFRYAEITTVGNVEVLDAEALVYGTDMFGDSKFSCSSDMLNRIQENFVRTLKTNFMGWPTDTGVRDERTPCDMDALCYNEMAMHNCRAHNYYVKWVGGKQMSSIGNADWAGSVIIMAWMLNKYYGDDVVIKEHYPALRGLAWGLHHRFTEEKFVKGFGDWSAPTKTNEYEDCFIDVVETNVAVYVREMEAMIDLAKVVGEEDDISYFEQFRQEGKKYFTETFFDKNAMLYTPGRQTPTLLALALNLCEEKDREAILAALVKQIREKDNSHLNTGIFGTRKLIEVLSESEEGKDLVFDILHQTTYPSYGKQIVGKDATTAWEQWYNLQGMMTCSHSMFMGIGVDFYKYFAGIKDAGKSYKKIKIEPIASEMLTSVDCTLETERGNIVSQWSRDDGTFKLHVEIPANTTADVILPDGTKHSVGSGSYDF